MEMPKIHPEHKKLEVLVGKWAGTETLSPSPWDPKGGTATARMDSHVDLDGFFLITDYVEERQGTVCYRGHGVFGWDAHTKHYTMHWFDTMGPASVTPATGQWEGPSLVFAQQTPMGHNRFSYIIEQPKHFTMRIEHSKDGKDWTVFMEGKYKRID
ncbi:MAG: DUF1579 domain-containing protein [Acidobacteriia bacterium]|nr:DUF1579 domain-containing protein [Terriglobia bacterium]